MNSGIYQITHKETGRSYIGQSKNLYSRVSQYKSCHKRKNKTYIELAITKYGWESFEFKPLVYAEGQEYLDLLEQKIIAAFCTMKPNGFNLREGGSTATFSESTRKKMSAIKKQYMKDPSVIQNLREKRAKQVISKESYKKVADAMKNKKWMNNGKDQKRVSSEEFDVYLKNGYSFGRLRTYVTDEYRKALSKGAFKQWARIKSCT